MGCPLAAAAFTLALNTVLSKTNEELEQTAPNTTDTTAYMDDINIITDYRMLPAALGCVKNNLRTLGLQLNDSKTECWINPACQATATHHVGIPRTERPTVLKSTAQPMPIMPDPSSHDQFLDEHAPELQRLVAKRTSIAKRLKRLHAAGLCTHVAQALWRAAAASDATFAARTTGLDLQTANSTKSQPIFGKNGSMSHLRMQTQCDYLAPFLTEVLVSHRLITSKMPRSLPAGFKLPQPSCIKCRHQTWVPSSPSCRKHMHNYKQL